MKATVNRLTINYDISGKPDGPVLMMSHSLGTCLDMWQPQLPALEAEYRVLRYDTRGHGGSDVPQGAYTLEELAGDAVGLLDVLDIERVIWVGISMGGMIGQALALNHTKRLQALVLCDTTARMPEQVQPVWQERIDRARTQGMPALVEETLQRWFTPSYLAKNPPPVEMIREQVLATPANGFIGCSEAIRRLDYLEQLSGVSLPTLVIVGEQDPGTPVAESEAICEKIPHARLQVLDSAAHLCNIEQADAFNRTLVDFLTEIAGG